MKSPFLIAGAAVAFALTFATPAAGQGAPADRKALEEKIRALETKQEETAKSLEALKTSLGTPAPAAAHADLQRQLEAIEKQQAETKATLETIQKEMSQRHPGPIEAPGLTTKSSPCSAPPARSARERRSTRRSPSSRTSSTTATTARAGRSRSSRRPTASTASTQRKVTITAD